MQQLQQPSAPLDEQRTEDLSLIDQAGFQIKLDLGLS